MTPTVGVASDNCNTRCGKRTPWYIMGTLLVIPSFSGIWMYLPFVNQMDDAGNITDTNFQYAWYLTMPAIFNLGWASVQISNMAIVNSLTCSNRRRDKLANNRNGLTAGANICILTFALISFVFIDNKANQFRLMAGVALAVGCSASLFYICTIKEVKMERAALILDKKYKHQEKISMGL